MDTCRYMYMYIYIYILIYINTAHYCDEIHGSCDVMHSFDRIEWCFDGIHCSSDGILGFLYGIQGYLDGNHGFLHEMQGVSHRLRCPFNVVWGLVDIASLRLVASFKARACFAEYSLFCSALLHKRHTILRSLLIVATL